MEDLRDAKITSLFGSWHLMVDALNRAGIDIDLEGGQVVESDEPSNSVITRVSNDIFVVTDDTGWSYIRIDNPEEAVVKAAYHAVIDAHHQDWLDVTVGDGSTVESFRLHGGLSSYNPNPGGWVRFAMQPVDWLRQ